MFSNRGAGRALMAALKKGDVVVVTSVDRVSRRLYDLTHVVYTLSEKGVDLIVLNIKGEAINMSSIMGKSLLYAIGLCAELESEMKADRTRQSHLVKKKRHGESAVFLPRWGYRKTPSGVYVIDEDFIPECREIYHMVHNLKFTKKKVRSILEKRICESLGRPFRDSEFHEWTIPPRYVSRAIDLYKKYLNEKAGH